ncbi:hypothetical protein D7231_36005, partial [Streptomyces klenkii]
SIGAVRLLIAARERGLDLTTRDVFRHRTVAELARVARESAPEDEAAAPWELPAPAALGAATEGVPGGVEEVLPLSPLQAGFHARSLLDGPGRDAYVVQQVIDLAGELDSARLREAARTLLRRHAPLRACFRTDPATGTALQLVARDPALPWQEADLGNRPEGEREAPAAALAEEERQRPFDPAEPPLLRCALIRLGPGRAQLVLTFHHIVADGWSLPVLHRELLAAYGGGELPPVAPYRAHLAHLARQDAAAARDAWRAALAGVEEPTRVVPGEAGAERPRPAHVRVELPGDATARLAARARELGVTPGTLVQTAWGLLAGRLTGRQDVLFGTTVS